MGREGGALVATEGRVCQQSSFFLGSILVYYGLVIKLVVISLWYITTTT